jgi:uncharacterized protein YkwD
MRRHARLLPSYVRPALLPLAAALVVVVPPTGMSMTRPMTRPVVVKPAVTLEDQVLAVLNRVRMNRGLRPLRRNPGLTTVAERHSVEMVRVGYFGHESPDGSAFWRRIERFYGPGIKSRDWSVGEVLLWQEQRVTARTAVKRWLESPPHRENVLRGSFREVGVAAVRSSDAPGVYGNRRVVVLTVDFGRR